MDPHLKSTIRKYALQNAVKYKDKANPGAVIGKVFAENPDLKSRAKEISKEVIKIIKEINKLPFEKKEKKLQEIAPELLEKKEAKEKDIFDFLEIREGKQVVTAFPPEPSKYPHIGHAKAMIVNYELAKRHDGAFYIRFEDTNPELAENEFYKIQMDNYEWLGIKPDKIDYASDHMAEFYKYAEKIINANQAYICTCDQKTIKENRRNGVECHCRLNQSDYNLKKWHEMFKAKHGKYVLRLKGHMQSQNTTLRDPIIFRIIDAAHPRKKKKYRVWPTYDFETGIMDGIEGVTHRLRSKEFELRNELQRLIQTVAGLQETRIYEFARFNLEGVESSGRIIRDQVKKKKLIGWDDPSLTTIVALRRRGFLPEAIKEFVLSTGITKTESVLTWDDLIVHNRRHLDLKCNRHFFVEKPKEIKIENAPEQSVELKLHPESKERGTRKFKTKGKFYIAEKDFKEFKDGKLYRLMDCINFKKHKGKFVFDSKDYQNYKKHGEKIIHWLPVEKDLVKVEVLMPDKKIAKGLAEPMIKHLKEGETIQFARFGFCKLDKKEKSKLVFWYTHD
ncbi:glutamate--tRNA ligase [Candidatus Woesearchaeota archaeon]|jgi:glutamyl-tRNA synthetase|nr:glutamate--tRNA ligase [Candidatus Woesearchaeota archaeon]|tara:strand:+ start:7756 stop:9441 length:1686 start_codon:yes stop_codon:yes gene_type:complete